MPKLRLRRALLRIGALSTAASIAILGGLSLQMSEGHDPALGPKLAAARSAPVTAERPRRIVKTTLIRRLERAVATPPAAAGSGTGTSVPSTGAPSAPAAPAPAPSTPAPAPAPAPAPVQTSTS